MLAGAQKSHLEKEGSVIYNRPSCASRYRTAHLCHSISIPWLHYHRSNTIAPGKSIVRYVQNAVLTVSWGQEIQYVVVFTINMEVDGGAQTVANYP